MALHVDDAMARADQRLGLLMRGMQMAPRPRQAQFDRQAVLRDHKAHVRSIVEYGSVIWSGGAKITWCVLEAAATFSDVVGIKY